MKGLLQTILLSCLKATLLVEKDQISGLNPAERIQLKVHLSLCDGCRDYKDQSIFIGKSIRQKIESGDVNIQISKEELERIKGQILSKLGYIF